MIAVGGSGGASGAGDTVQVTNELGGNIWVSGAMSNGIFAQSVGGGGGDAGAAYSGSPLLFSTSVGGNGSGGGIGGSVTVDNSGMIETDGASSQAIFAQSVGGGGGNGGSQVASTRPRPPFQRWRSALAATAAGVATAARC